MPSTPKRPARSKPLPHNVVQLDPLLRQRAAE
jgi:hypothetical protein